MSTEAVEVGSHVKVVANERTGRSCMAGRYGYVIELRGEEAYVEFTGNEFGLILLCDLKVQHHVYEDGVAGV